MNDKSPEQLNREMRRALTCLYIAVEKSIAKDVEAKVLAYVEYLEDKLKEAEETINILFASSGAHNLQI